MGIGCGPRINVTKGNGKRQSSGGLRLSLSLFLWATYRRIYQRKSCIFCLDGRICNESGAVKAIETMHNMILRGKRMFVEEARTRRDNKHVVEYGTRYQVVCESFSRDKFVQGAKVVHGRVWDSSVDLVMLFRGEVEEQEVKTGITKEILDEWKLVEVEQCPIYVTSMERYPLADITMLKYNEVEEDRVRTVLIEEVVNEWNFANAKIDSSNKESLSGQNSNWSESRSSDRTITWPCGGKNILMKRNEGAIVVETSPIDIESEVIKVKSGEQRACDSIGNSKDVESGGEWVPETVEEKRMLKPNDLGELESRIVARTTGLRNKENQPSRDLVENYGMKEFYKDKNFMSTLKEINKAQDLKRWQAKRREKARKCRPKMSKIRGSKGGW
ncbi:hypothetical protein PIB30_018962 [Stylosanthes scabra]|uniref:Uncharacterized protein n=1 Tax=Stylosanthes scabra TaxID=79078 RepID=A0ABU6Z9U2_9FABA|nr:hypothetical protein [Stylosanthes scabra]